MIGNAILRLKDLPPDPLLLFRTWFDLALGSREIRYPHAMCLSTVSPDGFPEGRIVLLHQFQEQPLCFFTDSRSEKGRSLARHRAAALTFYWEPLERQIRIQGTVEPTTDRLSDEMFSERPRGSKIITWASHQSCATVSRAELERQLEQADKKYELAGEDIPRPAYWQGYAVRPRRMEFWQAGARRMHDRFEYTWTEDKRWQLRRLSP